MNKTIFTLFESGIGIINKSIYLLISFALVGFLWGIVKFMFAGANEKARSEGRQFMLYGILILFVMTSMWSIVYLMKDFLGVRVNVNSEYNTNGNTYTTDGEVYEFDSQYETNGSNYTSDPFEDFDDLDRY